VEGILTPLSLLMPAFSLLTPPRLAYAAASLARERSPTARTEVRTRSFGDVLEPRYIIRARTLDQ
jgi:hypothetical protein